MVESNSLYDDDFVRWTEEQAAAIRAAARSGSNLPLDWNNLAEEIESLGKSQRTELKNRLRTLVEHLLKLECSSAIDPRRGWRETVRRTRAEVDDLLDQNPSLRRELPVLLADIQARTGRDTAASLEDAGEPSGAVHARLQAGRYSVEDLLGDWLPVAS